VWSTLTPRQVQRYHLLAHRKELRHILAIYRAAGWKGEDPVIMSDTEMAKARAVQTHPARIAAMKKRQAEGQSLTRPKCAAEVLEAQARRPGAKATVIKPGSLLAGAKGDRPKGKYTPPRPFKGKAL
jgi:hypothetical protein